MDDSRRDFLKAAGLATLGLGGGLVYLRGRAAVGSQPTAGEAEDGAKQWAMAIDVEKCDDRVRAACAEACHTVHNVPDIPDPEEVVHWIWSEPFEHAFPNQVHSYTAPEVREMPVLVLCNHCTEPACVRVCPTQATWKRESDGIVMMDMHRCIGCRYCMAACPYGARSFNWRDPRPYLPEGAQTSFPTRSIGVVEKCNFCAERLRDGLEPACVEAARSVPGGEGALTFGDLKDPESDVSQVLRDRYAICRKPSVGTGPNVFYLI